VEAELLANVLDRVTPLDVPDDHVHELAPDRDDEYCMDLISRLKLLASNSAVLTLTRILSTDEGDTDIWLPRLLTLPLELWPCVLCEGPKEELQVLCVESDMIGERAIAPPTKLRAQIA